VFQFSATILRDDLRRNRLPTAGGVAILTPVPRTTPALAAGLGACAFLLSACVDGAAMAREYVDHVAEVPLEGGEVVEATGYKDTSECGCSWMKVVLGIDGVDRLLEAPDVVAANLTSVLTHACAWRPSKTLDERWHVARIGQWHEPEVGFVFGDTDYGAAPDDCDPAEVEREARALVDRLVATMRLPGVAPDSTNDTFGEVTVERRGGLAATVPALREIWGEELVTLYVAAPRTEVSMLVPAVESAHVLEAIDRFLVGVPADREIRSAAPDLVCDDCDAEQVEVPRPALVLAADGTEDEVTRWAGDAGLSMVPAAGRVIVTPLDVLDERGRLHVTRADLAPVS